MPVRITRLEGPGKGRGPERFDDDQTRIRIGRTADCEIRYPASFDQVGRVHCTIALADDRYQLELGDNLVRVDGRPAFDEDVLPLSARVQLGDGREAPTLLVETLLDESLPETRRSGEGDPSLRARERTTRRLGALVAAGLVVVGAVAALFLGGRQSQVNELTDAKVRALRAQVEALGTKLPDVLELARRSTYMVQVRDEQGGRQGVGTAWVVGPGVLATNAHIAEVFEEIETSGTPIALIVRSGEDAEDHPVERVELHPSFLRLREVWAEYGPVQRGVLGAAVDLGRPLGYDVALLHVEPEAPLGPPLRIASDQALRELASGEVVAYFGYPTEGTLGANTEQPLGQSQIGHLTAVTDFFFGRGNGASDQLIHVSLPTHGGTSGSPVLNAQGEVVALVNAGNVVPLSPGVRVASGVGVNYAQRADLVRELLEGNAEARQEAREQQWRSTLARFASAAELESMRDEARARTQEEVAHRDEIHRDLIERWLTWVGASDANLILDRPHETLLPGGENPRYFEVETEAGTRYLAMALSYGEDIDLAIVRADTLVGLDQEPDWYPVGAFTSEGGTYTVLVGSKSVVGEAIEFSLQVHRARD